MLTAVADRNLHDRRRVPRVGILEGLRFFANHALERCEIGLQRIEVDADGAIRRHDVANDVAEAMLQAIRKLDDTVVDDGIDPLLELDEQQRVAGRPDVNHSASSSLP